ncbi:gamma-aminobutyric acid type B receptor subunit 2-like [Haliotis rufescens]|uniref:gamma-aminobutyric acid type B receptor subunit 2-like n=1 Tax=Haliotis rufescens TaxID=6454 RepID=UPI00201F6470|nr:gamma-aminobutyric acid type B receptor subunit 2-like [Haliotis rufescens]
MEGQYAGGRAMLPSATMAVDDINKRHDILPGYRLHMKWNNSKCDQGIGIKALADNLNSADNILMVIGGACSGVSEATAKASHLWNLVQATEDLIKQLDAENMTVLTQQQFFSDPTLEVQALKHHDARVIVGNFYPQQGRRVICQAFRIGLYGRKVVWLLPGWFDPHWYTGYNDTANCTTQDILKVIDNAFSLDNVYYNPSDDVSISNMTPSQFRSQYTDYINRTANSTLISGHERAPVAYDVMWAAAIALNQTNNYLQRIDDPRRIENFTYTDRELGQLIYDHTRQLNFSGITGRIQFDDRGDPRSFVSIRVFRDARNIIIGVSDITEEDIRWTTSSTNCSVFPDGRVPVDSVRVEERVIRLLVDITYIYGCVIVDGRVPVGSLRVEERVITLLVDITYIYGRDGRVPVDSVRVEERVITLPVPVYIAMCCLAGAAMVLAIVFLAFNIVCRNERIIKMSSPNLNNVILSGCVITYIEVFLADLDGRSSQCKVRYTLPRCQ